MFNIVETPANYFTRRLLHDSLSSNVKKIFLKFMLSNEPSTNFGGIDI